MKSYVSNVIAIPNELLFSITKKKKKEISLRTIKSIAVVYAFVNWGKNSSFEDEIICPAEILGNALGQADTRLTTELRKIYRQSRMQLPDMPFEYSRSYTKDNEKFIVFKVLKKNLLFRLTSRGNFTLFSIDDVLSCSTIDEFRILLFLRTNKSAHRVKDGYKKIQITTVFLKLIFGLDVYQYCYKVIDHPKYSQELLDDYKAVLVNRLNPDISPKEIKSQWEQLRVKYSFSSIASMRNTFKEIVKFNNRSIIEDYLEKSLRNIGNGKSIEIVPSKENEKHFIKHKNDKGYVSYYEIVYKDITKSML